MDTSRSFPQQMEQISACRPGQCRRGFRSSQILHFIGFQEAGSLYRIIGFMARTALHLKLELEHGDDEKPEKLATEICRQLLKIYAVRSAEVSSIVTEH